MDEAITKLSITSVSLTPNPVGTSQVYTISVVVQEKRYVLVERPEFEAPFSNESLTEDLIPMGSLEYEEVT